MSLEETPDIYPAQDVIQGAGPSGSVTSTINSVTLPRVILHLIVFGRELVVDEANEADSHFGGVIAPEHVADKMRLYLHLHHLKGTPQDAAEDIRVP